jgi:hypothetical protein
MSKIFFIDFGKCKKKCKDVSVFFFLLHVFIPYIHAYWFEAVNINVAKIVSKLTCEIEVVLRLAILFFEFSESI